MPDRADAAQDMSQDTSQDRDIRALKVAEKRMLTPTICLFRLVDPDGAALPAFTPGAHVSVETPSGGRRRYSLTNGPVGGKSGGDPDHYTIAVKRETDGRGGSASMVDDLAEGALVPVQAPENEFELVDAPRYLLIAGGIGITPVLAMARHLSETGHADFRVIYCTRSAEETAFAAEIAAAPFAERVLIHHDEGDPAKIYDFWPHFEEPDTTHVYCCGPGPLMDDVKDMTGHWPESHIHFEDFDPVDAIKPDDIAFAVTLQQSGDTVDIPADKTILETLRARGMQLPSSCETGVCGSCKTGLVSGNVDHRDLVLTPEEQADHIMICVSRAKDGGLVLDL